VNAEEHRALRELLGVYVLGQLDDDERSAAQAHLDGCPACQAEVAELAPLREALLGVDPTRVGALPSPPADLGDHVLGRIRDEGRHVRRRALVRRGVTGLVLAAAIVGAFVLGGTLSAPPSTPAAPPVQELTVRLAAVGLQADAGLVKHTWGTELKLEATGLQDGSAYTVTFIRNDGTEVPGGTFLGTGVNQLRCSLNGALPIDEASEVTVTDAAGVVVLDAVVV